MNSQWNQKQEHHVKSYILVLFIAVVMLAFMILGADALVIRGIYSWAAQTTEYHSMIVELALYYCILILCLSMPRSLTGKMTAVGIAAAVFLWCHAVFLPIVAAGGYLLFICAFGRLINRNFLLEGEFSSSMDFLSGSAAVIVLFCLMSALGIGAIPNLRGAVGVLAAVLLLQQLGRRFHTRRSPDFVNSAKCPPLRTNALESRFGTCRSGLPILLSAFILLMFLLQAGRMNISLDHDTLWYSVRSEYMLDNGPRGIYENMGTVSLVYTYSKGWEILTLPLADLPSHSFLLAFNLWITAFALYTAYGIVREYTRGDSHGHGTPDSADPSHFAWYAFLAPFLMSSVPGIMNTGISGKTDNITLLFQLIFVHQILLYLKSHRISHLTASVGAVLLSWTMKPTAIIFSTVICGASVLYLVISRQCSFQNMKIAYVRIRRLIAPLLLCFAALFLVWFRTWLFVGVPATSIFSGIFQKIGFTVRYPFLSWDLPDYGTKPTITEAITQLLQRLYGVFLLPAAEDMDRVLISWCSLVVLFFLLVWAVSFFFKKKDMDSFQRHAVQYGRCLLIFLGMASIYSIYSLKKVDGNYFILLYALTIIFGCILVSRISSLPLRRNLLLLLLPLTLFNTMMVSLSNLAWSVGFSKISFLHPGYYDHEEQQYQEMVLKGNEKIWETLAADPQTRVIAFGSHPEVLAFPCNVQSYVDISSSSGNELLVENTNAFQAYLEYAKTDYIYVEAGNMAREYLGYQLLTDCIQEGILTDIQSENGNILAAVDLKGSSGEEAEENLERFKKDYIVKMQ